MPARGVLRPLLLVLPPLLASPRSPPRVSPLPSSCLPAPLLSSPSSPPRVSPLPSSRLPAPLLASPRSPPLVSPLPSSRLPFSSIPLVPLQPFAPPHPHFPTSQFLPSPHPIFPPPAPFLSSLSPRPLQSSGQHKPNRFLSSLTSNSQPPPLPSHPQQQPFTPPIPTSPPANPRPPLLSLDPPSIPLFPLVHANPSLAFLPSSLSVLLTAQAQQESLTQSQLLQQRVQDVFGAGAAGNSAEAGASGPGEITLENDEMLLGRVSEMEKELRKQLAEQERAGGQLTGLPQSTVVALPVPPYAFMPYLHSVPACAFMPYLHSLHLNIGALYSPHLDSLNCSNAPTCPDFSGRCSVNPEISACSNPGLEDDGKQWLRAPENCPKVKNVVESGAEGFDARCSHESDFAWHKWMVFQTFLLRGVYVSAEGQVFNESTHFARKGCGHFSEVSSEPRTVLLAVGCGGTGGAGLWGNRWGGAVREQVGRGCEGQVFNEFARKGFLRVFIPQFATCTEHPPSCICNPQATPVRHMHRALSLVYPQATGFYHGLIEWLPQFLLLAPLLQKLPSIAVLGTPEQVRFIWGWNVVECGTRSLPRVPASHGGLSRAHGVAAAVPAAPKPRQPTPTHATPHQPTPPHTNPRHPTPTHATPHQTTPPHTNPRHPTPTHATPKPTPSHRQATAKPSPSHHQATAKPPSSHRQATPKAPPSHRQATHKPPPNHS
ncbi:unnamed protein product [Closterium sp. Naga37s-1]|nr:unnamed protein product [Closterium sp. Naga37s-1]